MKERKRFYSLCCRGGNGFHKNGQLTKGAGRAINIGETPDCDIRYDAGSFVPEYYATILRCKDGGGWYIVKRSQYVDIQIQGKGSIGYVQYLSDGDIIRFSGQEMALEFKEHEGNGVNNGNQIWQWATVAAICLLLGYLIAANFQEEKPISEKEIEAYEESVYLLKVDSVQYRLHAGDRDSLIRHKVLSNDVPAGTAFLTTDGILVTARHCVEYWLGEHLDLTRKVCRMDEDDVVRWAIETETFNQGHAEQGDSVKRLHVFFSIYNFMGNYVRSFESTGKHVHINIEHDGIFLMADFDEDYYWRSIRPYFVDKEMMLGDVLWIDSLEEKGLIKLATRENVEQMKRGTNLIVCGYPATDMGDKKTVFAQGQIKREVMPASENLCFESNINHGFSGGPLFCKVGKDIVAVGVVSRVDSVSSGVDKWAVPITEITK